MKKLLSIFLSVILILSVLSISSSALTSGGYTYSVENGKAIITGYTGSATSLTVPSTLGGYCVYAIGNGAFKNNNSLTSVTLSEGICEVGDSSFENCTKLSKITLPKTLTRFGENAILNTEFYNNKNNWVVRYDKEVNKDLTIGSGQDTYPWEFILADELEYLYLGTVLVRCHVKGIYNPNFDTTVIADGAFRNETGLIKSTTSVKTVFIGANAYNDCVNLSTVQIENKNCVIGDNAYFNTQFYNDSKNWKGDFLCIGNRAIISDKNATELEVGTGITSITNNCIGTKNVYITPKVSEITLGAFDGTNSVIYGFGGSFAESFANSNGFCFVDLNSAKLGDMDFDGELTVNDYAIYCESVACNHKMTKYEKTVGDITLDGAVDALDVIYIDILLNDKTAKIKGDANGDGTIDQNDYNFLLTYVTCDNSFVGSNVYDRCDLNGDGVVDACDVIYLDLYLNGVVGL